MIASKTEVLPALGGYEGPAEILAFDSDFLTEGRDFPSLRCGEIPCGFAVHAAETD